MKNSIQILIPDPCPLQNAHYKGLFISLNHVPTTYSSIILLKKFQNLDLPRSPRHIRNKESGQNQTNGCSFSQVTHKTE